MFAEHESRAKTTEFIPHSSSIDAIPFPECSVQLLFFRFFISNFVIRCNEMRFSFSFLPRSTIKCVTLSTWFVAHRELLQSSMVAVHNIQNEIKSFDVCYFNSVRSQCHRMRLTLSAVIYEVEHCPWLRANEFINVLLCMLYMKRVKRNKNK